MQALNNEYAFACAKILSGGTFTQEEKDAEMNMSEMYRDVLSKIIHLEGIEIELVGKWIWVTGNTKPVKDELKAAGFFFASKKCAWYYRSEENKTKGGKKSLDEIRGKYGSQKVTPGQRFKLTA